MLTYNLRTAIGKLLQCHIDPSDPETFVVGYLEAVSEEYFLLSLVSSNGYNDGFGLFLMDDLVGIESESDYLRDIELLLDYHSQNKTLCSPKMQCNVNSLLTYSCEENRLLAIELYKSGEMDAVGFVTMVASDYFLIQQVTDQGYSDGISYIRTNAVSRIYCNDESLCCREFLYHRHNICTN